MPHTMKKIFIFCLAFAALTSCKWKNEAESTPMLFFSHFIHSDSTHTDTLKIQIPSSSLCILDTISPLDTVNFVIGADAVYNILDSLSVSWNHDKMKASFTIKEEWFITERTDIPNGRFKFQPFYQGVSMPMRYIPLSSGTDTITIFLRSTTTAYGPTKQTIIQPVR